MFDCGQYFTGKCEQVPSGHGIQLTTVLTTVLTCLSSPFLNIAVSGRGGKGGGLHPPIVKQVGISVFTEPDRPERIPREATTHMDSRVG